MRIYLRGVTRKDSDRLARQTKEILKGSVVMTNYVITYNDKISTFNILNKDALRREVDDVAICGLENMMIDNLYTMSELDDIYYKFLKRVAFDDMMSEYDKGKFNILELIRKKMLKKRKERQFEIVTIQVNADGGTQRLVFCPLGLTAFMVRYKDLVFVVKEDMLSVPFELGDIRYGKIPFQCLYDTMTKDLIYELKDDNVVVDARELMRLLNAIGIPTQSVSMETLLLFLG